MKGNRVDEFVVASGVPYPQYGALCWRMHRGKVQVLLATSRDTGRWIIPKGWPIDGLTPQQTAVQEAWEEAGAKGMVSDAPIGRFTYGKVRKPMPPLICQVTVFGLRISGLEDKFPERKERRRKWFDAAKASGKVTEPDLRALLRKIAEGSGDLLTANPQQDA